MFCLTISSIFSFFYLHTYRSVAAMLELLEEMRKKLNEVEKSLSELESKSQSSDKTKRKVSLIKRIENPVNRFNAHYTIDAYRSVKQSS